MWHWLRILHRVCEPADICTRQIPSNYNVLWASELEETVHHLIGEKTWTVTMLETRIIGLR